MLQQAASRFLLLNRLGLQQAAAAAAAGTASTCLQQHPLTHQTRGKSSSAGGPFSDAADAQQSSSGWSWFGSAQPAAVLQPEADSPAGSTAAAAAAAADPAASTAAAGEAAAAMAAVPADASALSAVDLTEQADLLVQVSAAAAEATVAAAKAECWLGTRTFMDTLFWAHDSIGLPWFEAIVAANLVVKLIALPLTIIQQRMTPAMATMRQDTQKLTELSSKMAKAATAAEYAALAVTFQTEQAEFNLKYKGKRRYVMLGPLLAVGQGAVFISQFSAISTLAAAKLPSMTYEGAFWFSNLTTPDPIMALPIICAGATMLQLNSKRFQDQMLAASGGGGAAGVMQKIFPFMGVIILVAGYFQPSAMALLWASNALVSVGQNYLLWSPKFRASVGLPPMPALAPSSSSSSTPGLADLWKQATGEQQQPQPKPAEAAGAPPPGRLAVNYVASKPRARKPKS